MSALRTVAERLTHRVVLPRRLPGPYRRARIYVSSEGGLTYLRPRMSKVDPNLQRLAAEVVRPGSVVWDIGANVGLFTVAAAVRAGAGGRVLAVEPDTWLVSLLRRSAARNRRFAPVEILPVAVSDRVGVGRLHIARRNRSTNHLAGFGTNQAGGTRRVDLVPTVTLDWLAGQFPAPDVIKIDVEEAEALVLGAAAAVLAARPVIVCEVAAVNADRIMDLLGPYGYRFFDGGDPDPGRPSLNRVPWALLARV